MSAPGAPATSAHRLVFAGGDLARVRQLLLADSPLESACFLVARAVPTPAGAWRLVVHEVIELDPGDYAARMEVAVDLPPAVVAGALRRARDEGSTLVLAHSHPGGDTSPSARDLRGEATMLPSLRRRLKDWPLARLIVGPDGLHAALLESDGESPLEVWEIGDDIRSHGPAPLEEQGAGGGAYDRQVRAFGEEGQRTLAGLRVAVIGLGGTGSHVAQQLSHLGVGAFLLIDPDAIELTNLNRVVGASPDDVGRSKVDVARDMILRINPAARVQAEQGDVCDAATAARLLDCDVFLSCTDSHGSRSVMSQMAHQYALPGIDLGVAIQAGPRGVSHISGRVQMLTPGLPCLLCTGLLDSELVRRDLLTDAARAADPYIMGAPTPQPAVISINGSAASLAVTMLLSAVAGVPVAARNQQLRLELGVVRRVEAAAQAGCPVCSPAGAQLAGDRWPRPGRHT